MRWLFPLLAACTPQESTFEATFPDGFEWGSATAGFQVDMGCPTWSSEACDDVASDWYQWVNAPEIVENDSLYVSGEPVGNGPGMWETFEADVDLMQAQGLNAYRMSLEWSRLFPDPKTETATTVEALDAYANPEAVSRYHEFFAALAAADIHPLVTLNHYTLPLWVHDGVACHLDRETCTADGWVNEARITSLIALYAGWVAKEFGAEIDAWATLNEPFATTLSGYTLPGEDRSSPPGLSLDISRTVAVMKNQIVGHARMYDAIKQYDTVDADGDGDASAVGIVMNMTAIDPKDPTNELDVTGADHMDYLYHRLYFEALTAGAWDEDLDGIVDETRDDLANTLDYIGINYYNQVLTAGLPIVLYDKLPVFDFFPEFSWEPYPEGLERVVRQAAAYDLPIVVTENGTPFVEDQGSEVLKGHLRGLEHALADGIDVQGYYYWSFVDNYEWNHGFDLRFGLYELEPTTKERRPREVLSTYADIIARGRVDLPNEDDE